MIDSVLSVPIQGAFFYDDQAAIRAGRMSDGPLYLGEPLTRGFRSVRMPAHALSVGLKLTDGHVVWGDMMCVQYAAAAGREPLLDIALTRSQLEGEVGERLRQLPLQSLRAELDMLFAPLADGSRISLAAEFGLSQAVLQAFAYSMRCTMAEVLTQAYALPLVARRVPIYAQSGDDRRANARKMIMKRTEILPHGLINSPAKFGKDGAEFLEYAGWVADAVLGEKDPGYLPTLHFDLYGNAGASFDGDPARIAAFIAKVEKRVAPMPLNIESPADYGSVDAQIGGFAAIKRELKSIGSQARIVADEWCDSLDDIKRYAEASAVDIVQIKCPDVGSVTRSLEAILLCKEHGVGAHMGGSCSETDLSARVCVHVAVAGQADMQLAKPGMGVDEALSIVGNEQQKLLAELSLKSPATVSA
ncbi:methylaspartate ammonia-lyase [Xylophilus rhododendri]|uniref:methylaspartate ammonia-lyase n=1 Tax=Xylophilus rhododendri TaxID=2697032 RepID=A0A857J477_9BURK|nr:methylaspartate ammonia-lyase [Xylophilus rhododendri]QHI98744.1 methylaspartate ammonia-lyase [Xylophilus rhododendri]